MSLAVYDAEKMQKWDAFTIENEPISSIDLMERAASLATKVILATQVFESVSIFCGPGNNGGDGLVIARLLHEQKKDVKLFLLRFGSDSDDFKTNRKRLPQGISVQELKEDNFQVDLHSDLVIDAIFGSGLNRPVKGWIGKVIDQLNQFSATKVAIDIPSGLYAKDNHDNASFPHVFKADQTLSFMAPKMPFFHAGYEEYVGNFRILDIGLHPNFNERPFAEYITPADVRLNKRGKFDHKTKNGVLTLIAGLENMSGAAVISSKAAFKTGCGYLFTIAGESAKPAINVHIPEAIHLNPNNSIPEKTTALAIGPGLGKTQSAKKLLKKCFKTKLPLVLDADAINLLAEDKELLKQLPKNTVLTPHLGELDRLIGKVKSEEERLSKQGEFSEKNKVYILQKGAYSKITTPEGRIIINSTGNPGMGTAGMGDALTGIIGSLLAQGYSPEKAVIYGTFIHGETADQLALNVGELGWNATDLIALLPKVINRFVR